MEDEKKPLIYVVLILIIAALIGFWIFSDDDDQMMQDSALSGGEQTAVPPSVTPQVKLTSSEKSGNVSAKKTEILERVRSATPLTTEEKQEITLIMTTKANIYKFSEAERQAIFAAFNR